MLLWHPASSYPVRNLLFGLLRLVADASPLIVLAPSLVRVSPAEAAVVLCVCLLFMAAAVVAQLGFRTAFNLGELRRLVETRDRVEVFRLDEYLAQLALVTAPPIERFGHRLDPEYRILRLPRRAGFSAYQFAPQSSYILVPFRPADMTPGRLSGLLHEMGHIGLRNWLTATAYASYRVGSPGGESVGGFVKAEWANIRRRLLRLQAMETAMAWAAVTLFLHDIGPIEQAALLLFVSFSGYFRIVGARVEAEIEADQYQWFALTLIRSIRPFHPLLRVGEATSVPIVDTFLADPENELRNRTLAEIRAHAELGQVGPSDLYLWCGAFNGASIFAGIRIFLALVAAACIGAHAIQIEWWLVGGYAVACCLLVGWSHHARRASLRRLEATIALRTETGSPVAAAA